MNYKAVWGSLANISKSIFLMLLLKILFLFRNHVKDLKDQLCHEKELYKTQAQEHADSMAILEKKLVFGLYQLILLFFKRNICSKSLMIIWCIDF